MPRAFAAALFCLWLAAPAAAQSQEEGQMRLYILDLEERVRQLTGENERLTHEVNQLRAQLGMPSLAEAPAETGAVTGQDLAEAPTEPGGTQTLGTLSVSPDDPLIAPDGATEDAGPVDLSALAGNVAPEFGNPIPSGQEGEAQPDGQSDVLATTALSGSASDEYDLAYGYVLTGDYDLAEESFKAWLAAFPGDPQETDARFWLGESQLQQGEYRQAANAFLAVYKSAPDSNKGPDSLLKLGMSLSALGEGAAACATFAEVGRRYPDASPTLMNRVNDEASRSGC
jgi:tol-pal system protein YbgF